MDLNQFSTVDIVLDKANDNIIQKQTISAGDRDGRSLTLQVTDAGSIGEVPGLTANLLWTNHSSGVSDLSAFSVVDRTTSVFRFIYPQNMLTAGKVTAQIQLLHNGKVTLSKKFEIIVLDIAGKLKGVLQTAEYTALVEALAKTNEFETDIAEVSAQLAHKAKYTDVRLKTEKLEPEDMSASTLGLITGTGKVDLLSVPQDGSVTNIKIASNAVTNESIADYIGDISPDAFEIGTINIDSGLNVVNTKRIRVKGFFKGYAGLRFWVSGENASLSISIYELDGTFVESTTSWTTDYTLNRDCLLRIVMRHTDNAEVTNKNLLASLLSTTGKGITTNKYAHGSVTSDILATDSVDFSKVSFFENAPIEFQRMTNFGFATVTTNVSELTYYKNALTYRARIEPYETVTLTAINNNRFQIGILNSINDTVYNGVPRPIIRFDRTMQLDPSTKEYTFTNDGDGKELYLYVRSALDDIPTSTEAYIKGSSTVKFKDGVTLSPESIRGGIGVQEIPVNNKTGIDKTKEIYPVMFGVKMTNANDFTKTFVDTPRPIGWLYYDPETFDLLYATGSPENMKYLCSWNYGVTWNGTSTPAQYRPFITKKGDIVFVWRGDLLGRGAEINPDARQNPIIYPSGDYGNPVEVKLSGVKPTSWLQNGGVDYLYNQEILVFAEYTRPPHGHCNTWKVTEPITDPNNWRITKTFPLSGDNYVGMKHFHLAQYDPFSGAIVTATGDDITGAKILMSTDYGETWNIEIESDPGLARVCNFIFTKDYVYWASDDYDHYLIRAARDVDNKRPDFTTATKIHDLRPHPPTYVSCLIDEPYGILLLNRNDYDNVSLDLPILFWDIETETMHEIAIVHPTPDLIGEDEKADPYGFRIEAANLYQSRGDNKSVVGFANPANSISVLNNGYGSNSARLNNLCLEVTKNGTAFGLKFTAFQNRS